MAAFLFVLGVFYLGAVLAVTVPYWYEKSNTPCEDIPSAPYSPRAVIKLWIDAAVSFAAIFSAYALDPIFRHIEKADDLEDVEKYPPILLVHGLYHHPSAWAYLRRVLRKAGFRRFHAVRYSSWGTEFKDASVALENGVREVEALYPGEKPLLVGHSLGGIIIRHWLATPENQKRARGAVTLSAPHKGSKMAAITPTPLGQTLKPSNPFFAELARTEAPATIPCVSLASEADMLVLPQQNLVPVTQGWTLRLTPYATHAGTLVKGGVLRMVVWELHRIIKDTADEARQTPLVAAEKRALAPTAVEKTNSAPAAVEEKKAPATQQEVPTNPQLAPQKAEAAPKPQSPAPTATATTAKTETAPAKTSAPKAKQDAAKPATKATAKPIGEVSAGKKNQAGKKKTKKK